MYSTLWYTRKMSKYKRRLTKYRDIKILINQVVFGQKINGLQSWKYKSKKNYKSRLTSGYCLSMRKWLKAGWMEYVMVVS